MNVFAASVRAIVAEVDGKVIVVPSVPAKVKVLLTDGKSLLPVGVVAVEGSFERGDVVACLDQQNKEVARGLVNYSSAETARILRQPSSEIASILGYVDEAELIHRDNLILL